jgi:hypothetical protein
LFFYPNFTRNQPVFVPNRQLCTPKGEVFMPSPLPFMQDQKIADVTTEHRMGDDEDPGLMSCADELLTAVESKDIKGIARAMRSAFTLLESEPHEEGPHEE